MGTVLKPPPFLFALLEQHRSECVQVQTLVGPYVTTVRLVERVLKTAVCHGLVKSYRGLPQEITCTAGQEIEFYTSLLESGNLLWG